jgi:hypothetical protein
MKRLCLILVLAGAYSPAVDAQVGNPPVAQATNRIATFLRKTLAERSTEIAAAAAAMPADKYGFKAPPDYVTFGYLTWHIADGNYIYCSFIGGVPMPKLSQLSESDSKQTLMGRMKASFDFCTAALAGLDDSRMNEQLTIGDTKSSRAMAVLTLTGSWATHYEQQRKYLELNGYPTTAAK